MRIRYHSDGGCFRIRDNFSPGQLTAAVSFGGLAFLSASLLFRFPAGDFRFLAILLSALLNTVLSFTYGWKWYENRRLVRICPGRLIVVQTGRIRSETPWTGVIRLAAESEENEVSLWLETAKGRTELCREKQEGEDRCGHVLAELEMVLSGCGFPSHSGMEFYNPAVPRDLPRAGEGYFRGVGKTAEGGLVVILFAFAGLLLGMSYLLFLQAASVRTGAAGRVFLGIAFLVAGLLSAVLLFRFFTRIFLRTGVPGTLFTQEGVYCLHRGFFHYIPRAWVRGIRFRNAILPGSKTAVLECGGWGDPLLVHDIVCPMMHADEEWIRNWLDPGASTPHRPD